MSIEAEPVDRNGLINQYAQLVKIIASKIAYRLPAHIELDDLISSGTIGLIDAIDKFDRAKSDNFKKYAEIRIKGAILDELRSMDHVSRTVRRQSSDLEKTRQEMQMELGRAPSNEELAERLGLKLSDYHQLLNKLKPVFVVSFEDLGRQREDGQRDPMQFIEDPKAVNPQDVLHVKKLRDLVEGYIEGMKERERVVLSLYYYDDLNLKEIGKVLGVTESRVSQVLKEAVKRLRKRIQAHFSGHPDEFPQLE